MMRRTVHLRDRGASAVEFAIVLPILLLLVFAILDFGFAFFRQAALAGAAREAVREYAIHDDETLARKSATRAAPFIGEDGVFVSGVTFTVTPSTCTGTTGDATVIIEADVDSLTGLGPDLTLKGKGTMRCGA